MNIRQIVDQTLIAPARIAQLEALVDAKQQEIERLNRLLDDYRHRLGEYERDGVRGLGALRKDGRIAE